MNILKKITIVVTIAMGTIVTSLSLQAQALSKDSQVITMTRLPVPWYAPKFLVKSKMVDSIPEYAAIQGLKQKIYSIEETTNLFGGIYLWENQKSANDWFSPEWFTRVNKKYGGDNKVSILKAIFIYNKEIIEAVDRNEHWTNVSIYSINKSRDAEISNFFKSKIQSFQNQKGLQALWVASDSNSKIMLIELWSDRSSMDPNNYLELGLKDWKKIENIQTQSPIVLSNNLIKK
jgi:hypothetical protein